MKTNYLRIESVACRTNGTIFWIGLDYAKEPMLIAQVQWNVLSLLFFHDRTIVSYHIMQLHKIPLTSCIWLSWPKEKENIISNEKLNGII